VDTKVATAVQQERTVESAQDIDRMIISEGEEVRKMLKSRPLNRGLTLFQNFQDYKRELAVTLVDELNHQEGCDGLGISTGYALAAVVGSLPAEVTPPVFGSAFLNPI
jgi:hypothetical protein